MATFHVGGRYLHLTLGIPVTVTAYFGDQHCVNVRADDGREFQTVRFDQLRDLPTVPKAPAAAAPPPIHDSVGPTPDAIAPEESIPAPSLLSPPEEPAPDPDDDLPPPPLRRRR